METNHSQASDSKATETMFSKTNPQLRVDPNNNSASSHAARPLLEEESRHKLDPPRFGEANYSRSLHSRRGRIPESSSRDPPPAAQHALPVPVKHGSVAFARPYQYHPHHSQFTDHETGYYNTASTMTHNPNLASASSSETVAYPGHYYAQFPPLPPHRLPHAQYYCHYTSAHSPSFESYGSSKSIPPFVTGDSGRGPPFAHPPPHMAAPNGYAQHYYNYPWPVAAPPVEYITSVRGEDVLSGRGGATNSHSGNRAFRALVKKHQDEYLQAKKRDKPSVASKIVGMIRKKGGRFLRRVDVRQGPDVRFGESILWLEIGDDRAREKTCQALREGAPEIRRRQKVSSSDEDDTKHTDQEYSSNGTTDISGGQSSTSSSSQRTNTESRSERCTIEQVREPPQSSGSSGGSGGTNSNGSGGTSKTSNSSTNDIDQTDNSSSKTQHKNNHNGDGDHEAGQESHIVNNECDKKKKVSGCDSNTGDKRKNTKSGDNNDEKPSETLAHNLDSTAASSCMEIEAIMIRPSAKLLRRSILVPISLEQLTFEEKKMYLEDFLPPRSETLKQPRTQINTEASSQPLEDQNHGEESTGRWPVVSV